MNEPVGGGREKILYTLRTVRRIGLRSSAKALTAKNACKACGLGMGGQRGGMTNELRWDFEHSYTRNAARVARELLREYEAHVQDYEPEST